MLKLPILRLIQYLKSTLKAGTGLMNGRWAADARLSQVLSDGYRKIRGDMKSYFFSAGYGEKSSVKFVTFGGNQRTNQS